MSHPYLNLPPQSFWASAIAQKNMFDISGMWVPKFGITETMKVATYGSCFAQHIGRALAARGFNWFISEPAPCHGQQPRLGLFGQALHGPLLQCGEQSLAQSVFGGGQIATRP